LNAKKGAYQLENHLALKADRHIVQKVGHGFVQLLADNQARLAVLQDLLGEQRVELLDKLDVLGLEPRLGLGDHAGLPLAVGVEVLQRALDANFKEEPRVALELLNDWVGCL